MELQSVQTQHEQARTHLLAGRTQQAVSILQQIAATHRNEPRSRFILGLIAQQAGDFVAALDWLGQSIRIDPAPAEPYFVLGVVHQLQKGWSPAIDAYRQFLNRKPADAKAINNLGRCLLDSGEVPAAIEIFRKGLESHCDNVGMITNLGDAHRQRGDYAAAIELYRKAIQIDPNCAEAHGSLGVAFSRLGRDAEAIASVSRSIAINPRLFSPRYNLARLLQDAGRIEDAVRECQTAVQLRPESADAYNLLGNLYGITGQVPACVAAQRHALQLKPDFTKAHSNLLLSMQYLPEIPPAELFEAHLDWAARHAASPVSSPVFSVAPGNAVSNHRFRIGYVSPNFNSHSVAYFFEPVLAAHDRNAVEIFCYSDVARPDAITQRLQSLAEHWREIAGQPDARVLEMLCQDQLDVVVDLAGHTAHNRLPVFAHRPAPIQMTWIGYPGTTGMKQIDYRLTDAIADPPGVSDTLHTEKLLRIEGGCWAYQAPPAPPIAPFPAIDTGYVTFGSFNNLPKVTPEVIQIWATILSLVQRSRLLLKSAGLKSAMGRDYVLQQFIRLGIAAERVELVGWLPSGEEHLKLYHRIDFALDTFPYNGTTTTCEALWMGVPVITFAGNTHVSRVGAALLTHAGLTDWIADDKEGYIALAVRSAGAMKNHVELRAGLRDRLKASPLCDGLRLARQLEAIFAESAAILRG